jgi:hypothetical protein
MLATLNLFRRALTSDGEMMRDSAARQFACSSALAAIAALVVYGALSHHSIATQSVGVQTASLRHAMPIMTTAAVRSPSVMLATAQ